MNTKSLFTKVAVPVLSLGLFGGLGATLATSASAATLPGTVTASTHLNNHPDTTSVCDTVTTYPGVGVIGSDCVWAYDNATEKFTAVQNPTDGSWLVTMGYVGSFHGFADPRMAGELGGNGQGAALDSAGSVKGTIKYTVTDTSSTPDPSRLPGQSASDAHIGENIKTLFGDQNATVTQVPGSYVFTYHQIEGQDYTQVG